MSINEAMLGLESSYYYRNSKKVLWCIYHSLTPQGIDWRTYATGDDVLTYATACRFEVQ